MDDQMPPRLWVPVAFMVVAGPAATAVALSRSLWVAVAIVVGTGIVLGLILRAWAGGRLGGQRAAPTYSAKRND